MNVQCNTSLHLFRPVSPSEQQRGHKETSNGLLFLALTALSEALATFCQEIRIMCLREGGIIAVRVGKSCDYPLLQVLVVKCWLSLDPYCGPFIPTVRNKCRLLLRC